MGKNCRVGTVTQITRNRFLNFFEMGVKDRKGQSRKYFMASRTEDAQDLKLVTRQNKADSVLIYALNKGRVVLIRQYRYAIDNYIYEFPAGLVDKGETLEETAIREMKEETGLDLYPLKLDSMYTRPYFTSIGMSDESSAMIYGSAIGQISKEGLEDTEEIEVILADKNEVRRILKEENVAITCAHMLMHFLHTDIAHTFDFIHEQ